MTDLIDNLVRREGGYDKFTNLQSDRGGATRAGITLPALSTELGRQANVDDLKALTHDDIRAFYQKRYLQPFEELFTDPKLIEFCFDYAVHSADADGVPTLVIKAIQRAVGVKDDGWAGPKTKAAIAKTDPNRLFHLLWVDRMERFFRLAFDSPEIRQFLIEHPKNQAWNLRGWMRRIAEFV